MGVMNGPNMDCALISARALVGAVAKLGLQVGSLGILGNPAGLARAVAAGFHDLVAMPMEGLAMKSPAAFLSGINQGTSSFVKHISVGTLESITSFASSMSQNLDRCNGVDIALLRFSPSALPPGRHHSADNTAPTPCHGMLQACITSPILRADGHVFFLAVL